MTDEAQKAAASADAHASQIIEPRETDASAQGRGVNLPEGEAAKEQPKPLSTRDAIAKAFDEAKDKSEAEKGSDETKAKADDNAEAEKKAQAEAKIEDGKTPKTDSDANKDKAAEGQKGASEKTATGQDGEDARQSEGRKHTEPPSRFLPEARTKWANTPNEVKAEVHRVSQEYEAELETLKTQSREVSERYEPIRKYDEVARQNGRSLEQSLQKVTQVEQALARNPVIGLEMILREIGPRKTDGSPLSLYDISRHIAQSKQTPDQFAQNMNSALGQARPPQQQAQQRQSPELAELTQKITALEGRLASSSVQPVIEQFKVNRPDYQALEPQIATILKSKVVEQIYGTGLTPEQKLEQAYRMAGGQGPASQSAAPAAQANSQAPVRPDPDPDGQKSIRGAPSSGKTGESKRTFKSNRAALEAALAEVR